MKLAIIGRSRELARAELAALSSEVHAISPDLVVFEHNMRTELARLGGSIKQAEIVYHDAKLSHQAVANRIAEILSNQEGKVSFGVSIYPNHARNHHTAYLVGQLVKKQLRSQNINSRFIPPKKPLSSLNAAQVIHNKLIESKSEFIVSYIEDTTLIAQADAVQDIDWYTKRDYDRPFRDSKVGMLPPKLAQIMINLASPTEKTIIYDPFCGTGTLPTEAALMGLEAIGSDISERLIEGANKNRDWLMMQRSDILQPNYFVADATTVKLSEHSMNGPVAIATEGYLGNVDRVPDSPEQVQLNSMYTKFLTNMHAQLPAGAVLVTASPFWPKDSKRPYLPFLDQIEDLGYNYKVFDGLSIEKFVYIRPKQRVGRKIAVLIRK